MHFPPAISETFTMTAMRMDTKRAMKWAMKTENGPVLTMDILLAMKTVTQIVNLRITTPYNLKPTKMAGEQVSQNDKRPDMRKVTKRVTKRVTALAVPTLTATANYLAKKSLRNSKKCRINREL